MSDEGNGHAAGGENKETPSAPLGTEATDHLRNRVFCSSCGASAARRNGLVPLGWQEMPDANKRRLALCPECVRRNLWLIEARLDIDPGSGF